jgi:hypothetical protein
LAELIYICRLVKHALELKKPVMLLNIGPTRVDGMQEIQKLNIASGIVLREVAKEIMFASLSPSQSGTESNHRFLYSISGEKAHEIILARMLQSSFPPDGSTPVPRAAG